MAAPSGAARGGEQAADRRRADGPAMALAGHGETASGADGGSGALLRRRLLPLLSPALTLSLLAAAVFAGCGKGGETGSSVNLSLPVPCTNDATAEAIRSETATIDSTPIPFRVPDDELSCRIRKVLLQPADLPGEWERPQEFAAMGLMGGDRIHPFDDNELCTPYTFLQEGLYSILFRGRVTRATPGRTPVPADMLSQSILVFEPGRAAQFMAGVRRSCLADADADKTDSHARRPLAVVDIGDETLAFSREGLDDELEYQALVRRGDVIQHLSLYGDHVDAALLEDIARIADGRLASSELYLQPTPDPEATPTAIPPEPGSAEAVLDSALLTEDELPRGWVESGRSYGGDLKYCDGDELAPLDRARAAYSAGRMGALAVDIALLAPEDARRWMSGTLIPSCRGRVGDMDVTWTFQPLTVPQIGDQAMAWHAVSKPIDGGAAGNCDIEAILIRRGNLFAEVALSRDASYGGELSAPAKLDPQLVSLAQQVDANLAGIVDKLPDYAPLGTPTAP